MDGDHFHAIARALRTGATRRGALALLAGAAPSAAWADETLHGDAVVAASAAPLVADNAGEEQFEVAVETEAVRKAVDQWFVVLNAMLNGDASPFAALYSHAADVYYMGAEGTYRIGWDATWGDWQAQAKKSAGGQVAGDEIQIIVAGDMAAAAHITKGEVRQPEDGTMAQVALRETSVFRQEDGAWRMIGHHADEIRFWARVFGN